MARSGFSGAVAALFLIVLAAVVTGTVSCGEKGKAPDTQKGPDTVTRVLLDTGASYILPVAITLWPEADTAGIEDSVLEDLIIVPVGTRFRVDEYRTVRGRAMYHVRLTGGPVEGWKNHRGTTLDGRFILGVIGSSDGIPGWFDGLDLEGHVMAKVPGREADTSLQK